MLSIICVNNNVIENYTNNSSYDFVKNNNPIVIQQHPELLNILSTQQNLNLDYKLTKPSTDQLTESSTKPSIDPSTKPSTKPSIDQSTKPSIDQSTKPSIDQLTESSTKPSIDQLTNHLLTDDKRLYLISTINYFTKDDLYNYLMSIVKNDYQIMVYLNYIQDDSQKYNMFIIYIKPSILDIIIKKIGKISVKLLTSEDKIHYNDINYKTYISNGLIETYLLLIIGKFDDVIMDNNILLNINKITGSNLKEFKKNNNIKNYYFLNIEGLNWNIIIKLINELSTCHNIYQLSLYLI
jgi:hypothetical protein